MKKAKSVQPVEEVKTVPTPSTSTAPLQRLPSLRPPRDLTLSAYCKRILDPKTASKIKKIYIPNLNVQRNKSTGNVSFTVKSETVEPSTSKTAQSKQSRPKKTFVQLNQGVFSQGFPGQRAVGRGHSGSGQNSTTNNVLKRPVHKLQQNIKINKKEEEEILKNLLRDDFIDDPALETDFDKSPMVFPGAKEYAVLNKNCSVENDGKEEKKTVQNVLCNTDSNPGFILFQLPHSMPAFKPDPLDKEIQHNFTVTSTGKSTENKASGEPCPLSSLPAGQIGKLQILKSGKARLVLGSVMMCVEMGTQVTFKQDVVSAKLDKATHSGDLINIGPVKARMVVTPDWKEMLTPLKTGQTLLKADKL